MAAHQDGARVELVRAGDQPDDRGLPGAGVADERDRLAGRDAQVEAVQDRLPAAVPEAHVPELDRGVPVQPGVPALPHPGLRVDQRQDAFGRCRALLELPPERAEVHQRPPEQAERLDEQVPLAGREPAVQHLVAAEEHDRGGAQPGGRQHRREERVLEEARPARHGEPLAVGPVQRRVEGALLGEVARDRKAADGLVEQRVETAHRPLLLARPPARHAAVDERDHDDERHQQDRHARQEQVDREQDAQHAEDQHHLAGDGERLADQPGDGLAVGRDPADQPAGRVLVEERALLPQHGGERVPPEAQDHVGGEPGRQPRGQRAPRPLRGAHEHDRRDQRGQRGRPHGARHRVHAARDQHLEPGAQARAGQGQGRDRQRRGQVGPGVRGEAASDLRLAVLTVVRVAREAQRPVRHSDFPHVVVQR